ncbi:MAG: AAA family ATPase, partial [Victivallales bacterium]|nr:AAA family ATPase [Victivallales bacterium]
MMQKLLEWKTSMSRKPLLLRGARQVGKTWLLKEFGKRHFKKCAYVRFDKAKNLQEIFDREYDIGRLLTAIQLEVGFKPTPEDTLIIFDEIQQSASALTSLK